MGRRWIAVAWLIARSIGCAGKDAAAPEPAPAAPPAGHRDAGVVDGITVIDHFDPTSGMHLDDDNPGHPTVRQPQTHPGHPIDITLRSTPSGAMAAVDGIQIGTTPTYWAGEATGREHEFTFVLDGHATARYRFVPITSGVIHGRLEAVAEGASDAGIAPPTSAISAPPAPPTLVTAPIAPIAPAVDAARRPPPDAPGEPVDAPEHDHDDELKFGPRQ